jgi:hypothetical protein
MSGLEPEVPREHAEQRWLVQGDLVKTGAVEAFIATRDDIELLRRIAADVLLVGMGQVQADVLKARFGTALLIARDQLIPQPLQPPFDL